jgi:hypothetical protein
MSVIVLERGVILVDWLEDVELIGIEGEDMGEEEEEEVFLVSLEIRLEVFLLVTELESGGKEVAAGVDTDDDKGLVKLLVAEVKDDLVETELRDDEEEELAGTPTMTYPGVVPDERTVDVNPVAPADIWVVLVAYL